MKVITEVGACGITGGGDGHALVSGHARAGELADDPAISELIVEHDRVAAARRLTNSAEALPNRRDARRSQERRGRGFIKDLVAFVDNLYILRESHLTVGV